MATTRKPTTKADVARYARMQKEGKERIERGLEAAFGSFENGSMTKGSDVELHKKRRMERISKAEARQPRK